MNVYLYSMFYWLLFIEFSIYIPHINRSFNLFQFKPFLFCKFRTHYQTCCSTVQQSFHSDSLLRIYPLQPNLHYHLSQSNPSSFAFLNFTSLSFSSFFSFLLKFSFYLCLQISLNLEYKLVLPG